MDAPEMSSIEEPPSRFFLAWARFVLRFRWPLLILTLGSVVGSLALTAQYIRVDTSIEAFSSAESDSQRILEEFRDEFGRDEAFMVLVEGDVFTLDYLTRLKALHEELARLDMEIPSLGERKADRDRKRHGEASQVAKVPETKAKSDDPFGGGDAWGDEKGGSIVEETRSLINARRTRASAEGISVGELMDPFPEEGDLAALKAEVLADRTLVGQLVSPEAHHSVILVRSQFMAEEDSNRVNLEIARIAQHHNAPGFKTSVAGVNALGEALNRLMMHDLRQMLALSMGLMVLLLILLYRHPLGVIIPLAVVAMAAANTFGFMAIIGMPVTMLTNILPAFLICVGLGDSIHLLSVYRDGRRHGFDSHQSVLHTISHTGVPVVFTSVTTMVGLASFKFASLTAIQDMGIGGAVGVFMAMLHSLVFLPILLSFNKKSMLGVKPIHKADLLDRVVWTCLMSSGVDGDPGTGPAPAAMRKRRNLTLLVTGAVVALAFVGIARIRVYHNPLSWMPIDTPVRVAMDTMDQKVGGTATVNFLIKGAPENGLKDRDLLLGIEQLLNHVAAYRQPDGKAIVGTAISLVDVVKETNRALHGADPAHYVVPDSQRGVADALFLFENAGPDELRRLATNDLGRSQATVRIQWLDAWSYFPLVDHIEAGIKQFIPPGVEVKVTGSVYTLLTTIGSMLRDLITSFSSAFVIIALLMILLVRSLKLGLISMVPNLVPIIVLGGFMGFFNIPIDMNNVLIASIALGIAVDDTIHFLHHYRLEYLRSRNVEVALRYSMRHSGRAMVSTTVILLVGFAAYMAADMVNLQRFGLLIGLTCFVALIADLVITAALLRLFYRRPAAVAQEKVLEPQAI